MNEFHIVFVQRTRWIASTCVHFMYVHVHMYMYTYTYVRVYQYV